jgi:hypothetical protein
MSENLPGQGGGDKPDFFTLMADPVNWPIVQDLGARGLISARGRRVRYTITDHQVGRIEVETELNRKNEDISPEDWGGLNFFVAPDGEMSLSGTRRWRDNKPVPLLKPLPIRCLGRIGKRLRKSAARRKGIIGQL